MGVPRPQIETFWDMTVVAHTDTGSVIASTLVLPRLTRDFAVYELWSLRASISDDGTGSLASFGWIDRPIPAAMGNSDNTLMGIRTESPPGGGPVGNSFAHFGRSSQLAGEEPMIYLPPEFYWDGELHGLIQNGAGATVTWLFTVWFRVVTFGRREFPQVISKLPPRTVTKDLTNT